MIEKDKRWESIAFAKQIEAKNRYGFTITFNGTDENVSSHRRFLKFCEQYDGVYLVGLRVLLDSHEQRQEYECILDLIDDLEKRMADLQQQIDELRQKPAKKVLKTFGGGQDGKD